MFANQSWRSPQLPKRLAHAFVPQQLRRSDPLHSLNMAIKVNSTEKKAEIARDVIVAYLSHVKDDELTDLDKIDKVIERLVETVDRTFEVPERPNAGFGIPSLPQRAVKPE